MRRVIGVAAVVVILCSAKLAAAQQEGWADPPPEQETGDTSGGWGQQNGTTSPTQPEQNTGQQADQESATGGGTSGWGTPPTQTQPAQTQAPTPTPTTTPVETEPELTGDRFRMAHRIALGAHTHMSGAFLSAFEGNIPGGPVNEHGNTPWLNVSFMYTISRLLTIDIFFGFTVATRSFSESDSPAHTHEAGDNSRAFELGFGPRLLINLHSGDNGRLYTGIGAALLIGLLDSSREEDTGACDPGCNGWDAYGLAMGVPLGFEYRFRRVPNLALSAEVNLHLVFQSIGYRTEDDPTDMISQPHYSQIIVGLGNPRQPGVGNFVDFLSFLTIGFHYMF